MKTLKLFLAVLIAFAMYSCSDKKQQMLVDEITSGINEGKSQELSKAYPGIDELQLDLTGCNIVVNTDSIVKQESDGQLTVPAVITKKDGTKVPVTFTAKMGDEAYTIVDATGILPLSKNALWAKVASKTGALKEGASDIEVLKFINDKANQDALTAVLDAIKANLLKVEVKYARKYWHEGEFMMDCYGTLYYNVIVTNNSNYTFPGATANVKYGIYCGRLDMDGHSGLEYDHKSVKFKSIKPGENTGTFEVGMCGDYVMERDPSLESFSGISDSDYQKAMETYQYTGTEYSDYIKNK